MPKIVTVLSHSSERAVSFFSETERGCNDTNLFHVSLREGIAEYVNCIVVNTYSFSLLVFELF